jgi:peptidoglycan hydrolase-like protein with peptidoglycan-binding domain
MDVWEESLKRSLERRGRPRRSSVELYRLRPERDLSVGDDLQRSASYSELRRRATERSGMPNPGVALGGLSLLALVAGASLPNLLGSRAARGERVAYASEAHARALREAAVHGSRSAATASSATQAQISAAQAAIATRATTPQKTSPATSSNTAEGGVTGASAAKANAASARALGSGGVSVGTGATRYSGKLASANGGVATSPTASPLVTAVRELQQRLRIDPVDGSYGAITQQAVEAFQRSHGLVANGIVGSATREALGLGRGPTLRPNPELTAPTITAPTVTEVERPATPGTVVTETGGVTSTGTATPSPTGPSSSVQAGLGDMIAAGNRIATRPYVYGGGHASFNSYGYDCSGSVSYVLHAAGLLSSPEDSTELESYGAPGAGRYVTIYANSGHAWMTIEGRRYDTVALQETGTRWSSTMVSTAGYVVRHPKGY